jgi:hypothetical protein
VVSSGEALDGLHHVVDVGRRGDEALGALETQGLAIGEKSVRVVPGVFLERLVLRHGVANDLVVDIGDVHHVVEREAVGAEGLAQQVDENEGAEVADVREIVDGWATGVHADRVVARGGKLFELLGERVVETQRHHEGEFSSYHSRRRRPDRAKPHGAELSIRSLPTAGRMIASTPDGSSPAGSGGDVG